MNSPTPLKVIFISPIFFMIKNLCSEISLLNPKEAISEARMRSIVIHGLKPKYIPFVTSIQRLSEQASLEEFEKLLSSQELLANKLATVFIKIEENALAANKRNFIGKRRYMLPSRSSDGSCSPREKEESSNYYGKKTLRFYGCGEIGHIKRYF